MRETRASGPIFRKGCVLSGQKRHLFQKHPVLMAKGTTGRGEM